MSYISGQGTRVLTLRVPYYSPYQTGGDVGLSVGNACGVSSYFPLTHFNYSNSFRIAVSPNPAKNNLNVVFSKKSDTEEKANLRSINPKPLLAIKSTGRTIFTLFEFNTSLQVRQWKQNETKSNIQNLNIVGLRKGLYVLQVDRDNETTTTKIIVE